MSEKRLQMLNSSLQNMPPLNLKDRVAEKERKDEPRQEVGKFSADIFPSFHGHFVICKSSEHKGQRTSPLGEMGRETKYP